VTDKSERKSLEELRLWVKQAVKNFRKEVKKD